MSRSAKGPGQNKPCGLFRQRALPGNRRRCRPSLESLEDRRLPSTFLVTTTADAGPSSLRQAILDANANPGPDLIAFEIGAGGAQTIAPLSALPAVTDPAVIDGATQPGYAGRPLIELTGGQAGAANGLRITAGGSTVRGLVVNGFSIHGLALEANGGNRVEGNFLGTNAAGTAARRNEGSASWSRPTTTSSAA